MCKLAKNRIDKWSRIFWIRADTLNMRYWKFVCKIYHIWYGIYFAYKFSMSDGNLTNNKNLYIIIQKQKGRPGDFFLLSEKKSVLSVLLVLFKPVTLSRVTHFMPLVCFCIPWKHQQTTDFLMFSGDIGRISGMKQVKQQYKGKPFQYWYWCELEILLLGGIAMFLT